MRKFTLLTSVLLTAPFAVGNVLAQCVATQDCASLGYTETSCENGGIKCPFGDKWACKTESCNFGSNNPDCTYGSIYYHDGTCIKELVSGRIPIGIVVYDDAITHEKWIMALSYLSAGKWSTEEVDVPGITNFESSLTAGSDLNSCENTEAMLALGESKYPAAAAAKNYAPAGAENTKGKWCLPSAGIWGTAIKYASDINVGFSKTSSNLLCPPTLTNFWSSSEVDANYAWIFNNVNANCYLAQLSKTYWNSSYYYVRPVMKI